MKKVKTGALLLGLLLVLTGCGKNEAKVMVRPSWPIRCGMPLRSRTNWRQWMLRRWAGCMRWTRRISRRSRCIPARVPRRRKSRCSKLRMSRAAGRLYQAMQTRVENQKAAFENYNPNEMKKLQDPLVRKTGVTVVLCVSDDTPAAEKAVREALG